MSAALELDPYAYAFHEDPYPLYARLRREAPVLWDEQRGFFALSRHADVHAALRDATTFSNRSGVSIDPAQSGVVAAAGQAFLAMDAPRHTRMRALVSRGFTPRRVAALEPRVRARSVELLDGLVGAGRFDCVDAFAGILPMDVISELLGVPADDRAELRRLADLLVHREEGDVGVPASAVEAFGAIRSYCKGLLAERRQRPREDLVSTLLEAEIDGDRLDEGEILSVCNLMIVAGNETTTKLLANALYWLWKHPEQRARVAASPALIPGWVEETLRYDPSTQLLARDTTVPVCVRGTRIPAGARVVLLIGSANRDEEVFAHAAEFRIDRDTQASLAFGKGVHFCLGAALARLEARVALEEWWRRFPDYAVRPEGAVRVHSVNVRGFAHLPVEVAA